jgi:hypothetical protein
MTMMSIIKTHRSDDIADVIQVVRDFDKTANSDIIEHRHVELMLSNLPCFLQLW